MLNFPDGTQFSLFGLDETLSELYGNGRKPNDETAEEIIEKLEAMNNYIPSSEKVRREYAYVLLREYRKYLKERAEEGKKA